MHDRAPVRIDRRRFLRDVSRSTVGVAVFGSVGTLLAGCSTDDDGAASSASPGTTTPTETAGESTPDDEARAIVGDVVDFALTSDDWDGAFGFVTLAMHRALVDGEEAWFVRTDSSDEGHADEAGLVFVPRMRALAGDGPSGAAFTFGGDAAADQPTVLSSEPGRDDYTPAHELHRVTWTATPRMLTSAAEVTAAADAGEVSVEQTGIVVNAPLVVWSTGRLPADDELVEYLGPGQLIGEPDVESGQVTFKLHECFPGSRYIVTDTSAPPMATGMNIGAGARLAEATAADATGRVNVFMGGVEGPGPMGFQPSVFDSRAGDPVWSPYWDHLTYVWPEGADGRVLTTEEEIHAARDAGEIEEFVGTPDTGGQGFVVNCPVPVVAPTTFTA